jgi:DNA repair exonuclease SbcCD ATPase subunit
MLINTKNNKENILIIKEISTLEKEQHKKHNELNKINDMIDEYEKNKQKIIDNKKIDLEIIELKDEIKLIDNQKNEEHELYIKIKKENEKNIKIIDEYRNQIITFDKNIEKFENQIIKFKEDKILYEKNITKLNEITIIDKQISDLNKEINKHKYDLENIKDKQRNSINNKNLYIHFNNNILEANRKLKIAKVLEKAYDNTGFTKLIINEIIPNMEIAMSRITGTLCDYTIEIDQNLEIYLVRGHIKYKISGGSGSEKLIVNIAFRLWMVEFGLTLCKSSMMVIDESFNSFDHDRRLLLPLIIEEILKRYDKILIISHMEELKNLVKKTIKIKKINDISTIY